MANRTLEDRLESIRKKQAQLKAQEKELEGRLTEKDRKARTKRLIEVGAVVESLVGYPVDKDQLPTLRLPFQLKNELEQLLGRPFQENDLPKLIAFLKSQESRGGWFSKSMNTD